MRTQDIITTQTLILAALLAAGCSKNSSQPTTQATNVRIEPSSSLPPDMPMKDLGEVILTAGTQKRFSLGDGKECVITPTVLPNGAIQMNLAIESRTPNGQVQRLGGSQITQFPGKQCAISVGDIMVNLIPKLNTP